MLSRRKQITITLERPRFQPTGLQTNLDDTIVPKSHNDPSGRQTEAKVSIEDFTVANRNVIVEIIGAD